MDRLCSLRNRETLLGNDKLSPIEASRVNLRMVSIFLRIFQSFHSKLLGIFCFLFVINRQIIYNPIGFGESVRKLDKLDMFRLRRPKGTLNVTDIFIEIFEKQIFLAFLS